MTQTAITATGPIVLVEAGGGLALIPSPTPLTRLNYFDGKFLRASDLTLEQQYVQSLVRLSNQGGGPGVVYGYDTRLGTSGTLELGAGLAVDGDGRVLFLPAPVSLSIPDLIASSRAAQATSPGATPANSMLGAFAGCTVDATTPPTATTTFGNDLYVIAIAHSEGLCGEEDVYGRLCEDACATSTDRPYRMEGVVVRALPLALDAPTCCADWLAPVHLRSLVASAYYATERSRLGARMAGQRLRLDLWCLGAHLDAWSPAPGAVALGVVAMNGATVQFLDAWTARRERIEPPARRYWAWQMMMRPWDVFLAQVLQFQCQLHEVLTGAPVPGGVNDPCATPYAVLRDTRRMLQEIQQRDAATAANGGGAGGPGTSGAGNVAGGTGPAQASDYTLRLNRLVSDVNAAIDAADVSTQNRVLIEGGIVELPPAGYLPVVPGPVDVNTQVARLLGEGVDLRFCVVTPDYVAHALEEAQHMERICLLTGLDDPTKKQPVDILVPDGTIQQAQLAPAGHLFETRLGIRPFGLYGGLWVQPASMMESVRAPAAAYTSPFNFVRGVTRTEVLPAGGGAVYFAGMQDSTTDGGTIKIIRNAAGPADAAPAPAEATPAADTGPGADTGTGGGASTFRSFVFSRLGARATAGTTAGATPGTALWLNLRCERNPFALTAGQSASLNGEIDVGVSTAAAGPVAIRLALQGDIFCDRTGGSATGQQLVGRVRGWTQMSEFGAGQSHQNPPQFASASVTLELDPSAGGGGTVTILVENAAQGVKVQVGASWHGAPILSDVTVTIDEVALFSAMLMRNAGNDPAKLAQAQQEIAALQQRTDLRAVQLVVAALRENPDVYSATNAFHVQAIAALRALQAAITEPGFREGNEALLFPPPPAAVTEQKVLATADWVLFHRRRSNSCDCVCAPAAAPPARQFRVYEITAPPRITVDDIRTMLGAGIDLGREAQVVDIVTFDGGTSRLDPFPSSLQTDWQSANPGSTLIYGGIAAEGAAADDPEALEVERLQRLADTLAQWTPAAPDAAYDALPNVPAGLSAQGVDGVIFYVTTTPVTTECHHVYAFRDQGMMQFVLGQIAQGNLQKTLEGQYDLGTVNFDVGTDTVPDTSMADMKTAWNTHWNGKTVARAAVVIPDASSNDASAQKQGAAIAAALSGQLTDGSHTTTESAFGSCVAITLLEPGH